MPRLLDYEIASDADSMSGRTSSAKGYLPSDEGALTDLGILTRTRGLLAVNPNINISKTEIADFLNWFATTPKYPLPPVVRKILCLKRARLAASDTALGTSRAARTGQRVMIHRIDEMLRNDGMTDMAAAADAGRCPVEGSKFVAAAVPPPAPAGTSSSSETTAKSGSCHTEVICDTSGVLTVVEAIRAKIDTIQSLSGTSAPTDLTSLQTLIERKTNEILTSIAEGRISAARSSVFHSQLLDGLSRVSGSSSVVSDIRSIDSSTGPAAIILKLNAILESVRDKSDIRTIVNDAKTQLQQTITTIDQKIDGVRTAVGELPKLAPLVNAIREEFQNTTPGSVLRVIERLNALIAAVREDRPVIDIGPILAAIAEIRRMIDAFVPPDPVPPGPVPPGPVPPINVEAIGAQLTALSTAVGERPVLQAILDAIRRDFFAGATPETVQRTNDQVNLILRTLQENPPPNIDAITRQIAELREFIRLQLVPDPRVAALQARLEEISTTLTTKLDEIRAQPAEYERIVRTLVNELREDFVRRMDTILQEVTSVRGAVDSVKEVVREVCKPSNYDEALAAIRQEIAQLRTDVGQSMGGMQDLFMRGMMGLYKAVLELRGFAEEAAPYMSDIRTIREAVERLRPPTVSQELIDGLLKQITELEERVNVKDEAITGLEGELTAAYQFIGRLESEKSRLKAALIILARTNDQLRASTETKDARIEELLRTIAELRKQLEDSAAANQVAINELQARIAELEKVGRRKDMIIRDYGKIVTRLKAELAKRTSEYETRIAQIQQDNLAEFTEIQNDNGEEINLAVEEERRKCIEASRVRIEEQKTIIKTMKVEHEAALERKERECREALAAKQRECEEALQRKQRECDDRAAEKKRECDDEAAEKKRECDDAIAAKQRECDEARPEAAPEPPAPAPEPPAPAPEPPSLTISPGMKQYGEFTTKQLNRSVGDLVKLDSTITAEQKKTVRDAAHELIEELVTLHESETPNISTLNSTTTSLLDKLPKLGDAVQKDGAMLKLADVKTDNAKTFIEQLFNKLGNLTRVVKRGGGTRSKLNSNSYTRKIKRDEHTPQSQI